MTMPALQIIDTTGLPDCAGIYQLTCKATGDTYVGGTKTILRRCRSHAGMLWRNNHRISELQEAYNVHGPKAFSFKVLERCAIKRISHREKWWSRKLKPTYNLARVTEAPHFRRSREELIAHHIEFCKQHVARHYGMTVEELDAGIAEQLKRRATA